MKLAQKIIMLCVVVLLLATGYGLWRTAGRPALLVGFSAEHARRTPVVDQSTLTTARNLALMPTTAAERHLAEQALQLGDHEMDLAFATAVRQVAEHPPALSAEAKQIQGRLQKAETAVAADQARVTQLTAAQVKATGPKKDQLGDQLNLAKAQAELDQDEVDDAKEDLGRAGGDPQAVVQKLTQEHDAASKISDNTHVSVTPPSEALGLIHRFEQWSALHRKQMQLWQAKQDADKAAAEFAAKHDALQEKIDAPNGRAPASEANAAGPGGTNAGTNIAQQQHDESAAMLQMTMRRSSDQKTLATYDQRTDDQAQLGEVYARWIPVVEAEQRAELHHALIGIAIILGIALIGLFFDGWIESLLGKMRLDRRQVETLRTVTRVSVQIVAVLFILLVIFGPPTQLGTFLGLAGAGLTVALKDFIVGFLGWFVLMGKNGIRLGDWVEINGVTGEVVELGMFHTVLLETGNWTDSGHPTGRRVTFTNSFAIEGHYFNFSTSGQWLWDELQVVLPAGQDPYPVLEAFRQKVAQATEQGAREAEQEWKSAAGSRKMSSLSAAPAIDMKPGVGGVEITVRYITRANERYQLRAKLYHEAVDLLGGKGPAPVGAPVESAAK